MNTRLHIRTPLTQDMGHGIGDMAPHQFSRSLLIPAIEAIDQLGMLIPGLSPGTNIAQSQRPEPEYGIPQVANLIHQVPAAGRFVNGFMEKGIELEYLTQFGFCGN
jgi:hypothetical protein